MSKVVLQGYIIVPIAELSKIEAALKTHIDLTRAEAGCIVFTVLQDKHNRIRFDVYEEFIDQVAFELHQKRVKNSAWGKLTTNVERHYQIK